MESLLEKLEAYFATNSPEQIWDDWSKTAEFDDVGIAAEDFITDYSFSYATSDNTQTEYICNPEVTSGFFIHL